MNISTRPVADVWLSLSLAWIGLLSSACSSLHATESGLTELGIDDGAEDGAEAHETIDSTSDIVLSLSTGASLELAAQSVNKATSIGLERLPDVQALKYIARLGDDSAVAGAPHLLSPLGTRFARAATLSLPVASDQAHKRLGVAVLFSAADAAWKLLGEAQIHGETAVISLTRLSVVMLVDLDRIDLARTDTEEDAGAELDPDGGAGLAATDAGLPRDAAAEGGSWCSPSASCDADAPATSQPSTISGTLVTILAQDSSGFVTTPHEIELLNAITGEPLGSAYRTRSMAGSGAYTFRDVPQGIDVAIHVKGTGPASDTASTYDSITYYAPNSGEQLVRVSGVGTASVAEATGKFSAKSDRAALSGAVYQVDASGRRIGVVGCAQLFLDDEPHPAVDAEEHYTGANGLPVTLDQLQRTLAGSGKFYFGNLTVGSHTLKVSMDAGRTFVAKKSFFVPIARADASSPFKAIQYFIGLDIKGPNPTPAGCTN